MLAKCPNALRVLRLKDFGKQKFFLRVVPGTPLPISNLRKNAKFPSPTGND